MEATQKRARLKNRVAFGPRVSLSSIIDLAKETQRCIVEGEAAFNAGHVTCCGIRETTSAAVHFESLCLQTSAIKGPPHTINVGVCNATGAAKCDAAAAVTPVKASISAGSTATTGHGHSFSEVLHEAKKKKMLMYRNCHEGLKITGRFDIPPAIRLDLHSKTSVISAGRFLVRV